MTTSWRGGVSRGAIGALLALGWPEPAATSVGCIAAVSCGESEQVVLLGGDGAVWAWGRNDEGEAGVAWPSSVLFARRVPLGTPGRAVGVIAGMSFSAAVRDDGRVVAWGGNLWGQLGSGDYVPSVVPREVVGLDQVVEISGRGGFVLARRSDGSVWSWGENLAGQLGNGMVARVPPLGVATPAAVTGLPPIAQVATGAVHSLVLAVDGSVWAWGNSSYGQLGTGLNFFGARELHPVRSHLPVGAERVSAGAKHSLALDSAGRVWSWGANEWGQLGLGDTTDRAEPEVIPSLPPIHAIAAGGIHSLAIDNDGRLWAWGSNGSGELGQGVFGRNTSRSVPILVPLAGQVEFACGGSLFSMAKLVDGTLWAWGVNASGTLGNGQSGMPGGSPGLVTLPPPLDPAALVCPSPATVECGLSTDPEALGWALASGFCGPLSVDYRDEVEERCGGTETRTRRWTASEGAASVECAQRIEVRDTLPPRTSVPPDVTGCLWPPNHRMVCLSRDALGLQVKDDCDPHPTWRIVGCRSSQADDGTGDAKTMEDCVVSRGGEEVCVRAERDGSDPRSRDYQVLVVALDACGNESATAQGGRIVVPHDRAQAERVCPRFLGPAAAEVSP